MYILNLPLIVIFVACTHNMDANSIDGPDQTIIYYSSYDLMQ